MTKRLLLSALTCGVLLGSTALQAQTNSQTLINNQVAKHNQESKKVPKAVVEAIQDTFKAMHALEQNKIDDAKKFLAEADKKFSSSLAKDPSLDLLPLEESVIRYTYLGSSQDIQKALDLTLKLIKEHDTQVAQTILMTLKDEVDINIVSIPMKLYPVATKKALDALNKGDKKTALMALAEGFGMLVNTQIVIPTPLLVAQDLVIEASQMDKTKKDDVKKLLALAKEELKRAKLLGYTKLHTKAYELINEDIEKLEKEIKGKNLVEKLYEKLLADFKQLVGDTRNDEHKMPSLQDSVAQKEQQALQNPASIKGTSQAKKLVEESTKELQEQAKQKAKDFEQEVKKDMKDTLSK